MRYLRSISIASSMFIIALIGFLGISIDAYLKISAEWREGLALASDTRLVTLSNSVGALTHELQKERGASAGYIASKGTSFGDVLEKQRLSSDAVISDFLMAIEQVTADGRQSEKFTAMIAKIEDQIAGLNGLRQSVDDLNIELLAAVGTITRLNRDGIGLLPEIAKQIAFSPAANAVQRHAILMTAKDVAGLERATGATGFALARAGNGIFPEKVKKRFEALGIEMSVLLNFYKNIADEHILIQLNGLTKAEPSVRVQEMRDFVGADMKDRIVQIAPEAWFEASTQVLNIVKTIEDQSANDISEHMGIATKGAKQDLNIAVSEFSLIAFAYIALACFFVFTARKSLKLTSARVAALADGDIESPIFQPDQSDLKHITAALEAFRAGEQARKEQAELQTRLEASSADGIKRISAAVSQGDFEHRLRLRDLSGASLILGQGINEILQVSENFVTAQRNRDQELLEQQRAKSELHFQAARELNTVVQACSRGDFTKHMHLDGLDDSWTEVANGINSIARTTEAALEDIRRIMQALASGNLDERMEDGYAGTFAEISSATNASLDKLRTAFVDIDTAVGSVGETTSKLRLGTNDLAQRSGDQAQSVEASKQATDQLSDSILTNQSNLQDCRGIMKTLEVQTDKSQDVAKGAISSISAIETASTEMNKIVATIEEIAFQTNLLALNASVEAARAGEAGKGFSVVASEVRSLATRCSAASSQISDLISESVKEVSQGSDNVKQTGEAIKGIQSTLEDVLTRIETVSSAGTAQKDGVSSLEEVIQQLGVAAQSNLSLAQENSILMDTLTALEARLASTVSGFLDDQDRVNATLQESAA